MKKCEHFSFFFLLQNVFSVVCVCVCECEKPFFSPNAFFFIPVGSIPDEAKALSLLAPANAVAGILPGGGLLPMPNPIPNPPVRPHCLTVLDVTW